MQLCAVESNVENALAKNARKVSRYSLMMLSIFHRWLCAEDRRCFSLAHEIHVTRVRHDFVHQKIPKLKAEHSKRAAKNRLRRANEKKKKWNEKSCHNKTSHNKSNNTTDESQKLFKRLHKSLTRTKRGERCAMKVKKVRQQYRHCDDRNLHSCTRTHMRAEQKYTHNLSWNAFLLRK